MKKLRQLVTPYIIWSVLMLLLPMLLVAMYSLMQTGNSIITFKITFNNSIRFFTDSDFLLILWRSLVIAFKTTVICLILGYPIAYYISKTKPEKQRLLVLLITLPMWINMLVRTYAWIGLLSSDGIITGFLHLLGFKHVQLLYTETAVLIGMVYNFLPFMILQINTALSKMDKSLIEASHDLGADPKATFLRVVFPLSISGVVSGITLVFLPAVSSFFIPKLLGGGQYFLIGNVIENQFITVGEWNFGSAISMIIAVIMMLLMMLVRKAESYGAVKGDE